MLLAIKLDGVQQSVQSIGVWYMIAPSLLMLVAATAFLPPSYGSTLPSSASRNMAHGMSALTA